MHSGRAALASGVQSRCPLRPMAASTPDRRVTESDYTLYDMYQQFGRPHGAQKPR